MWILEICIVILQSFIDFISTRLVKFQPFRIQNMHVEIYANNVWLFSQLLLKIGHHLFADAVVAIGLQNSKGENIGVPLPLVVFDADGIGSDDNVIVVCVAREFRVLISDLHVQTCRIFDGERFEVEFPKYVYVLGIDLTDGNLDRSPFAFAHQLLIN